MEMSPKRLLSGNPRVDEVFDGGLPANGIVLLMGLPGAGKTILAQQYLFNNSSPERPGVYLSTVSEPMEKILRYGESLDYFDPEAIGTSVYYQDLGDVLIGEGLDGILASVDEILRSRRPEILVIDSFKAIHDYVDQNGDLRSFLHQLAASLSAFPVTVFLLGEYSADDSSRYPEFAVVDTIVSLEVERAAQREKRVLQITKLRGSDFRSGRHAYRITNSGLDVFPRLADMLSLQEYRLSSERMDTGVPGLDDMLAEGLYEGSSTLVAGPSGSGKTLLGLHFIFAGTQQGQSGLIATFQENPIQLERVCAGFGWSLDSDKTELMYRSPVDLHIDEWVYDLLDTSNRVGAKRILIDSLGDLRMAAGDEIRFREYVYSLLQRLSRSGISVVMTQETAEFFGTSQLSERGISHLSDNVVLLHYVAGDTTVNRAITVLKTRGTNHDHTVRHYDITERGMAIGEPVTPS